MQQIYSQRDEQLEVFTTIFSPQVCRTRARHVEGDKVAVVTNQYRSRRPRELDLEPGDLIQVLVQVDESCWFGRLENGAEGFFPSACVELMQGGASSGATPTLLRRGSVPAMVQRHSAPCGCSSGRSTPRLLRKTDPHTGPAQRGSAPSGFLCRVLTQSRRRSCCPLLGRPHGDTSADNNAFQPD
ncbi:jouberin-like [Poeciliopsis prolifica]|uniref:jouberin-like n=1 Tax=Poeciliopsis prolifica TaxID=188132 RepID=UPI002414080D|nr:jouberin-like [Poeciliopsis prolifica]